MNYQFPEIRTINDVLPVIKDRKEFVVVEKPGYVVVNYVIQTGESFPSVKDREEAILRECRGIAFDENGQIISRPLHKFFNIGEREETLPHNINIAQPHHRLEKLDGSMIRPIYLKNHKSFRFGTRMGITDVAFQAEVFISRNPKYFDYCHALWSSGDTPVFEWVSPKNKIVINYERENLIVVAVRDLITGQYRSYDEMCLGAKIFGIDCVPAHEPVEDLAKFLEETRAIKGLEGYVIRFNDGHMLKVKGEEYIAMHKSKDIVGSERKIIELFVKGNIDDVKPLLFDDDLKKVIRVENDYTDKLMRKAERLNILFQKHGQMDRKEFALLESSNMTKFERSAMFKMMDGGQPLSILTDFVKNKVSTDSKYGEFLKEFQNEP